MKATKMIGLMYYLYILKCRDKTLYTGITTDLKRRIEEHNIGKVGARYTRSRRPVELAYSKKFKSRSSASKEECRIKKMTREEKMEIIRNKNK
jgi:putative endonuclease